MLTILFSFAITGLFAYTRNWILNNIIAEALAIFCLEMMKLSTFKTGMVLLMLLFFYDIYWVFGSQATFGDNVMVTVAKSLDIPIKLLFPTTFPESMQEFVFYEGKFSLLGLGDIAIPGIFIALCLRFDYFNAFNVDKEKTFKFSKPYFYSCLLSYFVGLSITLYVLNVFGHAQPALLYLSPACILSVILCSLAKKQFYSIFEFISETDSDSDSSIELPNSDPNPNPNPNPKAGETADKKKVPGKTETKVKATESKSADKKKHNIEKSPLRRRLYTEEKEHPKARTTRFSEEEIPVEELLGNRMTLRNRKVV
ncbi:hypothetical protein HK103_001422 [Boothiomyces macroporosus]|uniref:Uncharacterized protein n=1 Tax=Boothiomyces macroporosus TaxID=261099 RepID=A0AAD5UAU1_9FUNG|nr:hypothetical protein HK103_001422 [Boothiomyces macroporosus]